MPEDSFSESETIVYTGVELHGSHKGYIETDPAKPKNSATAAVLLELKGGVTLTPTPSPAEGHKSSLVLTVYTKAGPSAHK